MRKKGSTETTLTKHSVEMEADVKEGKPLEPKELVDWEKSDKEITGVLETIKVILELSDIKEEPEEWLSKNGYNVLTDKDGNVVVVGSDGYVLNNPVERALNILYGGKYAYLKKGNFELYGQVEISRYKRRLETPLGNIEIPITTVNGTPIFFNSKWCLSEEEKSTYELYNNKSYDYDRMELEKKIMSDLILYSQLGTHTVEDSKSIFDKIKKECEQLGILKKISFANGVFTLEFTWRMGTDSAGKKPAYVLPPFVIKIDFHSKTLGLQYWHPHRYNGGFCLGGELTNIKDQCFKNKDIYGLVMAMVQFANTWNSNDVGEGDRHPGNCIRYYINDRMLHPDAIENIGIPFSEIFATVAQINYAYFANNDDWRDYVREHIKHNDAFCEVVKSKCKSWLADIVRCYSDTNEEAEDFKAKLLS